MIYRVREIERIMLERGLSGPALQEILIMSKKLNIAMSSLTLEEKLKKIDLLKD